MHQVIIFKPLDFSYMQTFDFSVIAAILFLILAIRFSEKSSQECQALKYILVQGLVNFPGPLLLHLQNVGLR